MTADPTATAITTTVCGAVVLIAFLICATILLIGRRW